MQESKILRVRMVTAELVILAGQNLSAVRSNCGSCGLRDKCGFDKISGAELC